MKEMGGKTVSVMMPAYNADLFLATAVDSVLAQSYQDWELIIVDDGSTDRTAEIAAGYQDPRVRLIRKENGGEASARNRALEEIKGEYLAFLDSDDLFLPDHLEKTVRYLDEHPERDAVYTDGHYINSKGERLERLSNHRRGPFEGRIYEEVVRASDVFGPPICVVLRSAIVKNAEFKFDTRIVIGPDWDFLTQCSDLADFGYIDESTCLYRVHESNITVQVDRQRRAGYLALCRFKAISMKSFPLCSVETKAAVFYDLLVNLLRGQRDRQRKLTRDAGFEQLPASKQAWIYRLMASNEILDSGQGSFVRECLTQARTLEPGNRRGQALEFLFKLHPRLARSFIQVRRVLLQKDDGKTPFGKGV